MKQCVCMRSSYFCDWYMKPPNWLRMIDIGKMSILMIEKGNFADSVHVAEALRLFHVLMLAQHFKDPPFAHHAVNPDTRYSLRIVPRGLRRAAPRGCLCKNQDI